MAHLLLRSFVVLMAWILTACSQPSAPSAAPESVTISAGDGRAVLTWKQEPGFEYWIMYAVAPSITRDNYKTFAGANIIKGAQSPRIVSGLTNDVTYSFIINATKDGSPAGPATDSISATPRGAGNSWTNAAPLSANSLKGFAFGFNRYIAVGGAGSLFTGIDGIQWNSVDSSTTEDLNAVTFNNFFGQAFAVGNNGKVVGSKDTTLSTWTTGTSGVTVNLNSVVAGLTLNVAVGAGGTIITSANDNNKWTTQVSNTTQDLNSVAYISVRPYTGYVAVGNGGTLLTSSNGFNWTPRTTNTTNDLRGVVLINSLPSVVGGALYAVAVGKNGTAIGSTDLVNWTTLNTGTNVNLNSVTYGSQFIAAGEGGTLIKSLDGVSWSLVASNTTENLFYTSYLAGVYLTGGANGARLYSQ